MNQRYGEYEQVNGATVNRLMDEVERLELIHQAALELIDGDGWWDLNYKTGLGEDRCKEILSLLKPDYRGE